MTKFYFKKSILLFFVSSIFLVNSAFGEIPKKMYAFNYYKIKIGYEKFQNKTDDFFNILLTQNSVVRYAPSDWVHPYRRPNYPGYAKRKKNKKNSKIWKYSTNRSGGNTRGGGTTEYNDYRPLAKPLKKWKK